MNRVFPHYRGKTLDNYEANNPILKDALVAAQGYAENLGVMKANGSGIAFIGQNGVGKTHLACAVMTAAANAGYKIECIDAASYMRLNMDLFHLDARFKAGYEDQIDELDEVRQHLEYILMKARFLLLDDLGREHQSASGWSNGMVFSLLRYRHVRNLPTIITTNLSLYELDDRYTEGITSFLYRAMLMVQMVGEDYCAPRADRD